MLVSKQWLEEFIDIPASVPARDIASRLTLSTVEVERVSGDAPGLAHIVVGKITAIEKHPNADRLRVCRVDVGGGEPLQIVCGGSNLRQDMMVAVALPGASVRWHGEGDPVTLAKTTIRDVESFGMICASDEIGLGDRFPKKEEKEILDVTGSHAALTAGQPLAEALGGKDAVFEIDNKSMTHRPDLWGHYGMAREVAALFGWPLRPYKTKKIWPGKRSMAPGAGAMKHGTLDISVEDASLCPRYMAALVSNVRVAPSPAWMRERLLRVGVRPVNNVVDVTNYVMMETGQPMHAFDATRLHPKSEIRNQKSTTIVVRNARAGEKLVTLDGKERLLSKGMLVIADDEKAIAIAGVMGGARRAVTERTTAIIFESANFSASSVRKTSVALGLRSESSARFEKGLDLGMPPVALARAVELLCQLCPDAVVLSVAEQSSYTRHDRAIVLPHGYVKKKLGVEIADAEAMALLARLGCAVKKKRDGMSVVPPEWRSAKDMSIPEDLVEEIARLYGYDRIAPALPSLPLRPPEPHRLRVLEHAARDVLAYRSRATESYNYSFVSPEWLGFLGLPLSVCLELENPVAGDRPLLRRDLFPGLVENVEKNLHRFESVRIFEIGRTYHADAPGENAEAHGQARLPKEDIRLGIAVAEKGNDTPFFDAGDMVRTYFDAIGVSGYRFLPSDEGPYAHPGRTAAILFGKERVGWVGEIHPRVAERIGLLSRAAVVEISLNAILPHAGDARAYHPIRVYPSIVRDIAFTVAGGVSHASLELAIRRADPLVADISLFDVYSGKKLPAGQKSMAYRITLQAADRTLSGEEADAALAHVWQTLKDAYGAAARA